MAVEAALKRYSHCLAISLLVVRVQIQSRLSFFYLIDFHSHCSTRLVELVSEEAAALPNFACELVGLALTGRS